MIAGGVSRGAISAVQAPLVTDGKPISGMAGTSGNSGARFGPTIASARNLPSWISCSEVLTVSNVICTSPATTAVRAGPPPLYGTCRILVPLTDLNSSALRCGSVPTPPVE